MFREGLLGWKQWRERSTCNELNLGKLCLLPGKKSSHLCSLPLDSLSRSRIRISTRTFPSIIWAAISPPARTPTPVVRVTLAGRGWDWSSCELIPSSDVCWKWRSYEAPHYCSSLHGCQREKQTAPGRASIHARERPGSTGPRYLPAQGIDRAASTLKNCITAACTVRFPHCKAPRLVPLSHTHTQNSLGTAGWLYLSHKPSTAPRSGCRTALVHLHLFTLSVPLGACCDRAIALGC